MYPKLTKTRNQPILVKINDVDGSSEAGKQKRKHKG